jgi:hypothetical protein
MSILSEVITKATVKLSDVSSIEITSPPPERTPSPFFDRVLWRLQEVIHDTIMYSVSLPIGVMVAVIYGVRNGFEKATDYFYD